MSSALPRDTVSTAMDDPLRPLPASPPILASDAEREHAVTRLREAVGEGRLTLEEFTERVGLAQTARTDRDLARLAGDLPAGPATTAVQGAAQEHRALCSHLSRSGHWSLPSRSSWRSIFGTIDLDLRQARLEGTDIELQIYNLFGTVTVIVPDGVEVVVRGGGPFASQKLQPPASPPIPGGPRLTIDTHGPGGTLHVRSRPALKSAIKALITGD
jgi:hypothetical protein